MITYYYTYVLRFRDKRVSQGYSRGVGRVHGIAVLPAFAY